MNRRLKKKAEKKRRKKIHEIMDLVLDINGLGSRTRGDTGDLPTAFLEFYGHVACLDVYLHPKGWEKGESDRRKVMCRTNGSDAEMDHMIRILKLWRDRYASV